MYRITLRRRISVLGVSILAACLMLAVPTASLEHDTPAVTVKHVSIARGFERDTELLFTMVQQDVAAPLIVTETGLESLRWLAQLAVNIVDYVDEDSFTVPFGAFFEVNHLIVDPDLNVHIARLRRERDGSITVEGPTLHSSVGDPHVQGRATSIAVIPRPPNPIDPWIAVGTDMGNVIVSRSGFTPYSLAVGGPVVDLAVVPQVGHFAFVALVNDRVGQPHLVGIEPPPDDGLSARIVFDLAVPPPDDDLVDLASPPPDDSMPLSEPAPVDLVAANGTRSIYRLTIPASPAVGGRFSIERIDVVRVPIKQVATGSLALLPWDGSGILYDPAFDLERNEISTALRTVFGNSLEIFPETLQRSSNGQFMTAVIESAGGKVADILPSTIRLELNGANLFPDLTTSLATGDVDGDGELDLVVKFNRRDFQALIPPGTTSVRATVRWKFADWTTGFASSEIRVSEGHGGH